MYPWASSISIAYVLGSIPFGYLLIRVFRDEDVRATGSGNIGATNVARSGGKKLGIATLVLDCLKGIAAVLIAFAIARHSGGTPPVAFDMACAAALAAVLGHMFPVWLGFRGGKGVATALGVFLVLSPATTASALLVFAVVFALTRFVSLASIVAALAFAVCGFYFVAISSPWRAAAFVGIPLLVIVKHHANLRRLLAGEESRFGAKPTQNGKVAA
jgi:glycerol-3-phosphate acyltransferase PlsY